MKNQKGISLIALIITIIVIIILAAIVITMSLNTPEQASFANYCNAIGALQEEVTVKYGEVFTNHTIRNQQRTRGQIFQEIATGSDVDNVADVNTTNMITENGLVDIPEIQNNRGETLNFYISDNGVVFNIPAYEYEVERGNQTFYYSNSIYDENASTDLTADEIYERVS